MSHDHAHHHEPQSYGTAFALGIGLNLAFVVVEFFYGLKADSLALIADAGHNLSDVGSLILAWGAMALSKRPASDTHTYGLKKATIIAAVLSAILLVFALGSIAWEAVGRLRAPRPVEGLTVIAVAAIGFLINTVTALLFAKGSKSDLNIRGAFLHMAADAAVSAGVIIAGALIYFYGWLWIDPVMSLIIVAVIMIATWQLLRDSINYSLDGVPKEINLSEVRNYLSSVKTVVAVHDLHVWPLSTSEFALTAHLSVSNEQIDNALVKEIGDTLEHDYNIAHVTLQIESSLQAPTNRRSCGEAKQIS